MPHPAVLALAAEVGREEARDIARRELTRPIYHRDDPSLAERVYLWILEQLARFLEGGVAVFPGGWFGLLAIVVVLVLLIVAIRLRLGPMGRRHAARSAELGGAPLTPEQHRRAAEQAAAAGRYPEAIRERLRAVARDLEVRAVIDPRPGRTADELAAEAGAALPSYASELRAAARIFDDVWYGARPATHASYQRLARLDEEISRARPVTAGAGPPAEPQPPPARAAAGRPQG